MKRLVAPVLVTLFLAAPALAGHAIFEAVKDGDRPRVTKIVRADPDAVYVVNAGKTALDVAVEKGDDAMVYAARQGRRGRRATSALGRFPPILTASRIVSGTGDEQMVATLLRLGAKPNAHVRPGDTAYTTPLHAACAANHPRIALKLLQAKARVNVRDTSGATPLLLAMSSKATAKQADAIALLARLLEAKASVNQSDNRGRTPLMEAAAKGYASCVKKLLDAGADPSLRDGQGQTAVARAMASEHYGVAKVLEAWAAGDKDAAASAADADEPAATTAPTTAPAE